MSSARREDSHTLADADQLLAVKAAHGSASARKGTMR